MIKAEEMEKRKEQMIEKASKEIARKCYELIEKKVNASFYEYAENDRISIEYAELDRCTKEIMESYEISCEKNPKLFEQITERAENKLQVLINKYGWKLDYTNNQSYILPKDKDVEE